MSAGSRVVAWRRRYVDLEIQHLRRLQPGIAHVVGIADPGHRLALDRTAVLEIGEDVRHDLAGWYSLVRPLITGTRELAAKRSMISCSKVRIITMSLIREMT